MTLRRRIILKNAMLLGILLLMGGASAVGLLLLKQNLRVATDEYSELRKVEGVGVTAIRAKNRLLADGHGSQAIADMLHEPIESLRRFCAQQKDDDEDADHDQREMVAAKGAIEKLEMVVAAQHHFGPRAMSIASQADALDAVLAELHHLAEEMDSMIKSNQHMARRHLQVTFMILIALTATIVIAGAAISRSQYLSIARPVRSLREGVRRLAEARFSSRLRPEGDREFVELAEDFNRMAAELDDFYRRLEEKVSAKSKELVRSERLASVGFLAAGVAHEINNPMNIVSGHAELAMRRLGRGNDPATLQKVSEALQIIWDEAFRCKEITERMLCLVRPGQAQREAVSLSQIARDTANLVGGLSSYRDRKLIVRMEEDPLEVMANATEMRQVLLNLAVNALDAVEPGPGEVVIEGRSRNGWIELSVSDNGRGMSRETLERVFEPFYTEKRGTSAPGTGLGLSISHLIVEGHGGQIRAESAGPGKGSRFIVRLPAAAILQEVHA